MNDLLSGKVVVIVGGAGLLGSQFALAVAENGGVAIVADWDLDTAERVANKIRAKYPEHVEAQPLNITDKDSVTRLIDRVHDRYGHIDGVVNSAYPRNRNYGRKMEDVTYDDFCENVGMHVGGCFLVSQQFSLYFKKQGSGNIINISSIYGVMSPRFELYADTSMEMPVEYAAAKSALIHLTKYMSKYLKGTGIRCNAISPGGVFDHQPEEFLTKYNAQCSGKGMLDKNDVQGTLVFLLSDMSTYINGQNLIVDDGFSL